MKKELDHVPKELMVVEPEPSTDPYDSGVYPTLGKDDVIFLSLKGDVVIGDKSTVVEDFWKSNK